MAVRRRIDPKSRPASGYQSLDRIKNADPNRHYVFANPNDEMCGVGAYQGMGYDIELRRPDGPTLMVGKTVSDGQAMMVLGQVLMSRPMEEHEADFTAGQEVSDAMDRRILKAGNIEDGMRGQGYQLSVERGADTFIETENGA